MIIYPAIDMQNGKVVRLFKGDLTTATIYHDTPWEQARIFEDLGFEWLHLVDLDGAKEGAPVNYHAVREILSTSSLKTQLGGGIRTLAQIAHWLDAGINRVILGTIAVRDPQIVLEACERFPGQIVVGIDAREGMVAVDGWVEASNIMASELAKRFEDAGVAAIIYTDINRDGTGKGLNMESTIELAQTVSIPVIASGGVGSLEDIQAVKAASDKGVTGVIIGKAYYEGYINAADALKIAKG